MIASDGPDESVIDGLDVIIEDFNNRTEFMGGIKQNNKNLEVQKATAG